jgi:hypothetical protein
MITSLGEQFHSEHKYGGKSEKELTKKMLKYDPNIRSEISSKLQSIEVDIQTMKTKYEDIQSVYIPHTQLERFNNNTTALSGWFYWRRYINPFISLGGPLLLWIILMYILSYFKGTSCTTDWILKSICKFVFGVNSFENLSLFSSIIAVVSFGFFVMSAKHAIMESLEMCSLKNRMNEFYKFTEETREKYEDLIVVAHTGKPDSNEMRGCEQITGYANIAVHIRDIMNKIKLLETSVGRVDVCLSRCNKILEKSKEEKKKKIHSDASANPMK